MKNYRKTVETAAWIREQLSIINPHSDTRSAALYAVGFLSSVLAEAMQDDTLALTKFKLAVAAKWKTQQGPAAKE